MTATATAEAMRLWGPLGPWRDHSSWARSVVWSCGRPGYAGPFIALAHDAAYRRTVASERAAAFAALGIGHPAASIVVSAT